MGQFHRLGVDAGVSLAPGTSSPAIWGNHSRAAALTQAGKPVRPIGRGWAVCRHLGC